ncbi:MAG TPA: magnesium transporter [Gemmatimonadaceae bacterium]|nr:magnesium transporter [Gemmatimonadaceae bacterium]
MRFDAATAAAGVVSLARTYLHDFPAEATRYLDDLPAAEVAQLIAAEPVRYAVPVLERLAPNVSADVLMALPAGSARAIVSAMDPVRTEPILGWIDEAPRAALLDGLDPGLARELRRMAEYPPETAGRLMDPRAVGFRPGTTVRQAQARLRDVRGRRIADVFLTDDERRLTGRVSLQTLAIAESGELLESLAQPPVAVQATDPQDEIVERFTKGRLASLPVVDFEGRLLGVIGYDTLVTTAQENVAADMQAMVGASRQERALSTVTFAVRKRLPWLEINLATAFLAASVVGIFEGTIARFTALAVLLPVVAGQSGNTGAQALAVTMRGLAMREIRIGQWPRVVRKEAGVALINGIAVSLTTAAGVYVWSRSTGLALVIGLAMVFSMIAAGVAGVLVPIVLTALGQDPAQSSSIVLTTVTDVVGFASFLGVATLMAGLL